MADNLVIESPDFDWIRKETGFITSDAIRQLWYALNYEIKTRRQQQQNVKNKLEGKIVADTTTTSENNLDAQDVLVWYYNTASSVNLTGVRNGVEGRVLFIHNIGAGTITMKNSSGSSDTTNQLVLKAGADKAVATNQSIVFMYINSRWRELSLA